MEFHPHPKFVDELSAFIKRHGQTQTTVNETLKHIHQSLLTHFDRTKVFPQKRLGPAKGFGVHEVYFYKLILPECPQLVRTQHPKSYFYKKGGLISMLCCDSHIEDYKNSKLIETAKVRLSEMLDLLLELPEEGDLL